MAQLIDRQEVIKHIESCIDKNGYVDTTKFSDSMRNIFSMSYKTEEQIRADAIEEIKEHFMKVFDEDENRIRANWTNADIRETIWFDLEQMQKERI